MTAVLLENSDSETNKGKMIWKHKEKTVIYQEKLRREDWNRSFPYSSQRELTLPAPGSWTSSPYNCKEINVCHCGSAGKESTCNRGDLGLIPGLGRSLEKGKATHSSVLAWRIPWTSLWVAKSRTWLSDFHLSHPAWDFITAALANEYRVLR